VIQQVCYFSLQKPSVNLKLFKYSGGSLAAIIAMRFATHPVSKYSPRLQILIYPSLQFFDMMLPSYIDEHYTLLHYTAYHKLSVYLNETIDKSLYNNNHTSVKQKKYYRKYVDWSLIPSKYRIIYKQPITDDYEGDSNLIEKTKKALDPEVSPLLVEDEKLAKLPSTYILTVGHDRLRDEAFIYEGRLKRVGVPVVHNHYENTFHGSITFLYGLDIAREMVNDIIQYIEENL
jgi:acetyl esterase/lipase